MKDYYDELEVSHTASQEIINKAYKVLAKKYHPDTTKLNKEVAEEKFKKISEAYEILSNKQKRREYDENLKITNPQISPEDYNKLLHDNQVLFDEINNLKNQITNFNNRQVNNTDYYKTTRYVPNSQINNKTNHNNTSKSYSIIDIIKFKIKNFLKSIFAIILTIALIYIIFQILLHMPYTKNFLLDNLGFKFLFNIFK